VSWQGVKTDHRLADTGFRLGGEPGKTGRRLVGAGYRIGGTLEESVVHRKWMSVMAQLARANKGLV